MDNFRKLLNDTIADNEQELVVPSREYSDEEVLYMRGYLQALHDINEDFKNDFEDFLNELIKYQLN